MEFAQPNRRETIMPSLVLPDGLWANRANCAFDAQKELGSDADQGFEPRPGSLVSAEHSASHDLVDAVDLQNYEPAGRE